MSSTQLWNKYSISDDEFELKFSVIAVDQGQSDRLKSILKIKLTFINENITDNVYFNKSFYEFHVLESIKPGTVFGHVNSVYNGVNQSLVYSIIEGDLNNQFVIDYKTGGLSPRLELDFETQQSYLITVNVYNTLNSNRLQHSSALVQINVLNVNDNEPHFDKYEYQVEINENLETMTEIFKLKASDSDTKEIKYQLLNHLDKFYIDEYSGIIYNKITFDYESMSSQIDEYSSTNSSSQFNSFEYLNLIQLKIRAYDSDQLETHCILTVKIIDSNDNAPQFERAVFMSTIQIYDSDNQEPETD